MATYTDTAHLLLNNYFQSIFFSRFHRHTQVPVLMLEHRTLLSPCLDRACLLGDIPAIQLVIDVLIPFLLMASLLMVSCR